MIGKTNRTVRGILAFGLAAGLGGCGTQDAALRQAKITPGPRQKGSLLPWKKTGSTIMQPTPPQFIPPTVDSMQPTDGLN